MNTQELKNADNFVIELRKMQQAIYLACDAEVAADASLKIAKACTLINGLIKANLDLKHNLALKT